MLHGPADITVSPPRPLAPHATDLKIPAGEYRHILIPTSLERVDRPAVMVGLQMAAAYRARATLLHVLPAVEPSNSVHWLDALDNLNRALMTPGREALSGPRLVDSTRTRISEFLDQEIPSPLRSSLEIHVECRLGEVAEEITKFADTQGVDLTILCCEPTTWGLPILPGTVRRILQLSQKRVILVRPDTVAQAAG